MDTKTKKKSGAKGEGRQEGVAQGGIRNRKETQKKRSTTERREALEVEVEDRLKNVERIHNGKNHNRGGKREAKRET